MAREPWTVVAPLCALFSRVEGYWLRLIRSLGSFGLLLLTPAIRPKVVCIMTIVIYYYRYSGAACFPN